MNKRKRKLAGGLCLLLTVGMLTGCASESGKAIVTLNGEETEYAIADIMLRWNQAQMQTYYGDYFGDELWDYYGDSTLENIMSNLENMLVLDQHKDEYGVSLSAEEEQKITDAAERFMDENDRSVLRSMGATQERVERVLTLYTIQNDMYYAIIADTDTEVSDEEAAQKTIQYVFFSTAGTETDEDGNTIELSDDEKAVIEAEAEEVLTLMLNGESMDDAVAQIDEDKSVSSTSFGDNDESYSLDDAVIEAADELADGEVAQEVIRADNGYYVIQMITTFDEEATEEKKEEIIADRQEELYEEVCDGWIADSVYVEDSDLVAKLTFDDTYELYVETEEETE